MSMEEDDGEEVILLVELSGLSEPIKKCDHCSILGLDTPEPIIQVDNHVFKGRYEDTLGTVLLFKDDGDKVEYLCKTEKKLITERLLLSNKEQPTTGTSLKDTLPSTAAETAEASSCVLGSSASTSSDMTGTSSKTELAETLLSLAGPNTPAVTATSTETAKTDLSVDLSLAGPNTPAVTATSTETAKTDLSVDGTAPISLPPAAQEEHPSTAVSIQNQEPSTKSTEE